MSLKNDPPVGMISLQQLHFWRLPIKDIHRLDTIPAKVIFKTNHDKRSYDVKWWNTEFQVPKKTAWDSLSLGLHKFDGSRQHPNDVGCNLSICTWLSSETTLPEGWQGWPRLALLIGEVVVPGCIVKAVSRFHIITRSGARSRAILSDHNEELVQTP